MVLSERRSAVSAAAALVSPSEYTTQRACDLLREHGFTPCAWSDDGHHVGACSAESLGAGTFGHPAASIQWTHPRSEAWLDGYYACLREIRETGLSREGASSYLALASAARDAYSEGFDRAMLAWSQGTVLP